MAQRTSNSNRSMEPNVLTQVDDIRIHSGKTTFEWSILRFDAKCDVQPDQDQDTGFVFIEIKEKLVSKPFLVGEEVGIKSFWHIELQSVYKDNNGSRTFGFLEWMELEAALVLDKVEGSSLTVAPFKCQAKLSIIHSTENFPRKFLPESHVFEVKTVGQKQLFATDLCVVPSIKICVELEVFVNELITQIGEMAGNKDKDLDFGLPALQSDLDFGLRALQSDLEQLLNYGKEASDFTIMCDGRDFNVHKAILRARSKYFDFMLSNKDCKETQTNVLEVEEFSSITIQILLEFIYTGKISDMLTSENMTEVIRAANKYEINQLKNHCFQQLSITLENFVSLSLLAIAIHAEDAQIKVLKGYYVKNLQQLIGNEGFRRNYEELLPIVSDTKPKPKLYLD